MKIQSMIYTHGQSIRNTCTPAHSCHYLTAGITISCRVNNLIQFESFCLNKKHQYWSVPCLLFVLFKHFFQI